MIPSPCASSKGPEFISPTVIGTKKNARCLIRNEPVKSNQSTLTTPSAVLCYSVSKSGGNLDPLRYGLVASLSPPDRMLRRLSSRSDSPSCAIRYRKQLLMKGSGQRERLLEFGLRDGHQAPPDPQGTQGAGGVYQGAGGVYPGREGFGASWR